MHSADCRQSLVAAAVLAALAADALAAEPTAATQRPADAGKPGVLTGDLLWRPQISLTPTYDTNIFATPTAEVHDWIWTLSPTLSGETQWDRHRIRFDAGGDFGRYDEYGSEDYDDWWVNADGRFDLAPGSNLFGGLGFAREHEERGSEDATVTGDLPAAIPAKPTVYTSLNAHLGVTHRFGDLALRAGGTFERLDYDNTPSIVGTEINNDDRDRDVLGLGLRVSQRLEGTRDVFVQALWDRREYRFTPDDDGYYRDSDGYRLAVGINDQLAPGVEAEGYIGYLYQNYDDPRFDTVDGIDIGGKLSWRATDRTRGRLTLERSVNETTLAGSSSYLYTTLSGSVSHQLSDRTTLSANLGAGLAAYQDVGRDDWIYSAGVTAKYMLNRQVYVTGGYRLAIRDSNDTVGTDPSELDLYDYDRQQVFLTIGVLGYPESLDLGDDSPGSTASGESSARPASGFYVGAQAGHGFLSTTATPVGEGVGREESDHGDLGWEGGAFAGWGTRYERWYFGIEAEASASGQSWALDKDRPATGARGQGGGGTTVDRGESVSLQKNADYALSGLAGYALPGSNLLYGRIGVARAEFDVGYSATGGADTTRDSTTQNGWRAGVGSEIALRDGWFLRMDYVYTDYDELDVDFLRQSASGQLRAATEELDPRSGVFRLGVGMRFGGEPVPLNTEPRSLEGWYVGGAVGQLGLHTDVSGTLREGSSGGIPFPIDADYADYGGVGGVFAGWGLERDRWYVGIEVGADGATTEWKQPREGAGGQPDRGRGFSVARKESWGVGARVGYQLSNGPLLYGVAGLVQTRFASTWEKGENRDTWIARSDRLDGTRFGVGAELPLSEGLYLRLEYSYTDYDDLAFTTPQRNFDEVVLASNESLFRLGAVYHF
ncbi:MAG: outer membrane beta-barrel protein [Thermoanaerobaculales bacterium]|nr:outer membrane beta-barrel protein [Thermoanaerobaculales bacterium]